MSKKIGRFEYVKRGLVGVCAATMLAGMCAVPAFALTGADVQGGGFNAENGSKGTSTVTANVDNAQVTATVPSGLPVVIGAEGVFDTATDAKIVNTSVYNLHVSGVSATGMNGTILKASDYTLVDGDKDIAKMSITPTGGTAFDLGGTAPFSAAGWNVAAGDDLPFTYSGSMTNMSKISTLPLEILTVTWTIGIGDAS